MSRAVVVMLGVVLAACSPGSAGQSSLDVDLIYEQTSDFQKTILEDGVVTPAEYEKAVLASMQCHSDKGFTVEGPAPIPGNERLLGFTATMTSSGDVNTEGLDRAAVECDQEFLFDVGRVYAESIVPSDAERADLRALLRQCLVDAGLDVSPAADDDDLLAFFARLDEDQDPDPEDLMAANACARRHSRWFHVASSN